MTTILMIRKPLRTVSAVVIEAEPAAIADATEVARQLGRAGIGSIISEQGRVPLGELRTLAAERFGPSVPVLISADVAMREIKSIEGDGGFAGSLLLPGPFSMGRAVGARLGGAASSPTMFLVDKSLAGISLWTRLAGRISGGRVASLVDLDTQTIRDWLTPHRSLGTARTLGIAAAAVTATALPLAIPSSVGAAPAAASSASHGANASTAWADLKATAKRAAIRGDDARQAPAARTPEERAQRQVARAAERAAQVAGEQAAKAAEKRGRVSSLAESSRALTPTAVAGDGTTAVGAAATGSALIAGPDGTEWQVNTNVTFATSSSASGAMSEASLSGSVSYTASGATIPAVSFNDAFDGYGSLYVRNLTSDAATGTSLVYNRTGQAPVRSCDDRQLDYPEITMDGLGVSRTVYVSPDYPFARWLDSVTNPSATPVTIRFGRGESATFSSNNLGSDSSTTIEGTSSGDTTAAPDDSYVVTSSFGSGNDPVIGHVLWGGAGDATGPAEVAFATGDDNPSWYFEVTVEPGETVSIAQYVALADTAPVADGYSSLLAAQTPDATLDGASPGLVCMTEAQIDSLINFDKPEVTVDDVTVDEDAGTATLTFTRSFTGAPATMSVNLTDGTASAGDYLNAGPIPIEFEAGQDAATITVQVTDDTDIEDLETILVQSASLTGYATIADSQLATISINWMWLC